ncbi:DUF302 domain-containing protein [Labilibacter marinus]|uniref:DUF302 domain-containing protein n=1 Tax=Labilibacter marinus TaxID=1477105 RepID=UPI00095026B5|nr:DUF302 domain-containing protein [Labilibacter marinus]
MSYYFRKTLKDVSFEEVIDRVTDELKEEGFGVLTDIDVKATFKKKLDKDFRQYRILGACNPHYAYKALSAEENIGTMLPCNVVVQETEDNDVAISAINPIASMQAVENESLGEIAGTIVDKLKRVIEKL